MKPSPRVAWSRIYRRRREKATVPLTELTALFFARPPHPAVHRKNFGPAYRQRAHADGAVPLESRDVVVRPCRLRRPLIGRAMHAEPCREAMQLLFRIGHQMAPL